MDDLQIETVEIGILQQLLHEIGGARTLRADSYRIAFELVEGVDRPPPTREQEQRFRLRQPPECRYARVEGNRHAILHEGEGWNAASVFAGETGDVLDRPRRRNDFEAAVLLERARREPVSERMIGAGRRAGEDGGAQKRIVAGDEIVEEPDGEGENGERDQEDSRPGLSIAARPERQLIQETHASTPDAETVNLARVGYSLGQGPDARV